MLALLQNSAGYRILGLLHIISVVVAFGPAFLYTPLKRAGETQVIAKMHMRMTFPSLVLMWVFGMGLAGVGKLSMGAAWLSASMLIWLVMLVISWMMIRPAITDESESATSKLAAGVGITHLGLVLGLILMIWKPGA